MLTVENLEVRYGAIEAVRGLSFRVEEGEVVALLGSNGAGKSSTLMSIAGLEPAASGQVRLGDKTITGLSPEAIVEQGLSLSPEGRRVFGRLTIAENLKLGAIPLHDRNRAEERFAYVYELFPKLEQRQNQASGTLSGGEQQMLAIGRALMADPKLLMLDEPSLGLAPIIVDEIFNLIERLRSSGITMVLVEQNAQRALEISDRAYVISHGKVEQEGTSAELLADSDLESIYLGTGRKS